MYVCDDVYVCLNGYMHIYIDIYVISRNSYMIYEFYW